MSLRCFNLEVNFYKINKKYHNTFWRDVSKHCKKLWVKCPATSTSEFNAQCIFYNMNILIGHQTVYYLNWVRECVFQICHVLDDNGQYMSHREFSIKNPNINVNFLNFRSIIETIKVYQNRLSIDLIARYRIQKCKVLNVFYKGNKPVYFTLVNSNT